MRRDTYDLYTADVRAVVGYILNHLDEPLEPACLARHAAFSTYHFHRIFRGLMGESISEFVKRMRLERAACRLLSGSRVVEAALDAGYESHEAFTRAFREVYACAPSAFREKHRNVVELPSPTGTHYRSDFSASALRPLRPDAEMEVAVRAEPARRTAALRHTGPYYQIGPRFAELICWLQERNAPFSECLAVWHDDPELTPIVELRSDACAVVPPDFDIENGPVRELVIPGGLFAVTTHIGPYSGLQGAWERLCGKWLPASGYRLSSQTSFEVYRNDCGVTPVQD
ncbi:MAG TPA: GyrI-like domain-containing protein, partial [Chthonomonadales bacterium]|nr:GyrI-like domain-containing protein [Chthonomonadales bacterium]